MKTLSQDALLVAPRQKLIDIIITQENRLQEIGFQLEWFKRQVFGSKSEKFIPDDDVQTMLDLGIEKDPDTEVRTETIAYDRKKNDNTENKKNGHGRGDMPTNLPVVDETIEPDCDTTGMVRIGEEISWHYEMKPGSLFVKRTIRPKYAHPDSEGVVIGELPVLPVEKGNAGLDL